MRLALALTLAAMLCGAARADETYNAISANRDAYKRVVHLLGDSISRGWALGTFPDVAPPEVKASSRWPLRSPASMVNLLIADAGLNGEIVVAFADHLGFPDDARVATQATKVAKLIADNVIRQGDLVVLEDAGNHPRDPDRYELQWRRVLQPLAASGATVIMVDMFDYITDTEVGGDPADTYRFSVAFKGGATGAMRSHNDATAAAARSAGVPLIPLHKRMDAYRSTALDRFKTDPIHRDGIHPNIWGQCVFAAVIAEAAQIPTRNRAAFTEAFRRAEPAKSRTAVEGLVELCLGKP